MKIERFDAPEVVCWVLSRRLGLCQISVNVTEILLFVVWLCSEGGLSEWCSGVAKPCDKLPDAPAINSQMSERRTVTRHSIEWSPDCMPRFSETVAVLPRKFLEPYQAR